jgi:hypothetical protein
LSAAGFQLAQSIHLESATIAIACIVYECCSFTPSQKTIFRLGSFHNICYAAYSAVILQKRYLSPPLQTALDLPWYSQWGIADSTGISISSGNYAKEYPECSTRANGSLLEINVDLPRNKAKWYRPNGLKGTGWGKTDECVK